MQATLTPTTPNTLASVKIERTVSAVEQTTSIDVTLRLSNIYEQGSVLSLIVPKDQVGELSSTVSIICKRYEGQTLSPVPTDCLLSRSTSDVIEITTKAFCQGSQVLCPAQSLMAIRVENLKNPDFIVLPLASSSSVLVEN